MVLKAFVHENGNLQLKDMPEPVPKKGEVLVALRTAGLNRRDLYIPNRRKGQNEALILGSDGAGVIEAVGEGVSQFRVGDEVFMNPSLNWDKNSAAPPEGFDILGMPDHGTFAEKVAISETQVEKKPEHLTWEQAGVLALGGLTGYRALFTRGQVQRGETVFIPGVGSGVATFLVIFAKHAGAKVIVSSRNEQKRKKALDILGADMAIDTNGDWQEALKEETIDLVIDSVGSATFNRSLGVLKKGGRMVIFGSTTEDNIDFNLRNFFYGQYTLLGSTMGSKEELHEMLAFSEREKCYPEVDERVFTLDDIQDAFNYLEANEQFGKIAIKISE